MKKEKRKPFWLKSKLNRVLLKLFLLLLLFSGMIFGMKIGWQKMTEIKVEKKHALIFRELERCAQFITVKNSYSDIISIKKTRIAGLAKSFSIIKYNGVIRGGISDISESKITLSDGGKSVKVELPPSEVISNEISGIEVFDEGRSIFVAISAKKIMEEIRFNQESAAASILNTGFLDEADRQARNVIEAILYASGFKSVSVYSQKR